MIPRKFCLRIAAGFNPGAFEMYVILFSHAQTNSALLTAISESSLVSFFEESRASVG
jgi:hypothetical protein